MNTNNNFKAINSLLILICYIILSSCQHSNLENNGKISESPNLSSEINSNSELDYIRSNIIENEENLLIYFEKFIRDLEINNIKYHFPKEVIIELVDFRKLNITNHSHGRSYGANKPDLVEIYINSNSWKLFNRAQKHILMYHELSHDILNLEDLAEIPENKDKLMYPAMSKYELLTMDKFIDIFQNDFELIKSNQIKK